MEAKEFLVLTHYGAFVDYNMLPKGIYTTHTPKLFDLGTTIEFLDKQARITKDLTGNLFVTDSYFDNLKECTLTKFSLLEFNQSQESKWISVSGQPPEIDTPILIYAENNNKNGHSLRAKWIPKHYEEDNGDFMGDADYCEEKDEYFWPEGFYEWNENEETHWLVDLKVTHWQPLPSNPL